METPLPIHPNDAEAQDLLASETYGDVNAALHELNNDDKEALIDQKLPPASYWNLLRTHGEYRLFMASYVVTHCGEWFNYVASMSVLESGRQDDTTVFRYRHLLISLLIVVRLLPNVVIAPLGGVLADTRDLRKVMILLDLLSAVVALSFWLAQVLQMPFLIYVSTMVQECLAGLYEPCRSAIVPQMVKEPAYLHKATTLSGVAWSTMAAVGSSLGGFLVASLGVPTCFVLDSLSYVLSAWLLWLIPGEWNEAALENNKHNHHSWRNQIVGMSVEGIRYMQASPYGALIWIKFTGALMFGASDVMNAAFASPDNGELESERLGILFACVGIGAIIGPLAADPCVDMKRLVTVQRLCVASFGVMAIGYFGIGSSWTFPLLCVSTIVRAGGMSVAWIDSTLLIQTLMPAAMMGRICAADTALGTLGECISAVYAGLLLDYIHDFTPNQLAFLQALVALVLFLAWGIYHYHGGGVAASYSKLEKKSSIELTHSESL